jgi:hypothetical protein
LQGEGISSRNNQIWTITIALRIFIVFLRQWLQVNALSMR